MELLNGQYKSSWKGKYTLVFISVWNAQKITYTIKRSQSAQMFCPGGRTLKGSSWGVVGVGLVSGATTCRKPVAEGDVIEPPTEGSKWSNTGTN